MDPELVVGKLHGEAEAVVGAGCGRVFERVVVPALDGLDDELDAGRGELLIGAERFGEVLHDLSVEGDGTVGQFIVERVGEAECGTVPPL